MVCAKKTGRLLGNLLLEMVESSQEDESVMMKMTRRCVISSDYHGTPLLGTDGGQVWTEIILVKNTGVLILLSGRRKILIFPPDIQYLGMT